MRSPYTELYLHCVWATWDRLPLISDEIEQAIYGAVRAKSDELHCPCLAIGGMPDHLHLLVRLHATVAVADLLKETKGASSHLITHTVRPGEFFKWQGAYGAFSLAKQDAPRVVAYINQQKRHHAGGELWDDWEQTFMADEPAAAGG